MNLQGDGLLGWATGLLIDYDTRAPGLLRRALSASPQRRQAIFSALAHQHEQGRHDQGIGVGGRAADALALFLRDGSPRGLVEAVYGSCPSGLLGALERIGLKPLRSSRSYRDLHILFLDPAEKHRAIGLRHIGNITDHTIQIVMALRAPFSTHGVISRLRHIGEAKAFMRGVDIVQRINSKATDEAILDAVAALRPETRLPTLIDRLVKRADVMPAPPIPHDEEVRVFASATEVIAAGRHYRNCLRSKLRDILSGQSGYVVFRGGAIMEFSRLSHGGWLYVGCHGPRNFPVSEDIEDAARRKAVAHGIPHIVARGAWEGFGACGSLLPDPVNPLSRAA